MSIFTKTEDATSHKYKRDVYVELNPKTKQGQNLLKQYHEQSTKHYMDIGRIGYHDDYGKYKLDNYTIRELKVVPKLIISVTESAMNRAGRDVYKLRTYMSKFGQLNFLLTVDQNCAELFLIENIFISNLNFRQDYETLIWKINYYNTKPVPLRQIFSEFGIKANPDDYGKSWKEDDTKINNIIVAKSKGDLAVKVANTIGSTINQKVLVASLNNLNQAGNYGKKITNAYSAKVAKEAELNKLASSKKLENTLNHVLLDTIDKKTDRRDLKNKENFGVYKKVLDIQFTAPKEICKGVELGCNKESLKEFMVQAYDSKNSKHIVNTDEEEFFNKQYSDFEKIIDHKFDKKIKKETIDIQEENFNNSKHLKKEFPNEYRDFNNKKLNINLDTERFYLKEPRNLKKQREKNEKLEKINLKKEIKQEAKIKKHLKKYSVICDINEELEKSKLQSGIKTEKKKKLFFANREERLKNKQQKKEEKAREKKEDISRKLEEKIKKQNLKIANKKEKRQEKLKNKENKRKNKVIDNQFFDDKKSKKDKNKNFDYATKSNQEKLNSQFRPIVKPAQSHAEKNNVKIEQNLPQQNNFEKANQKQQSLEGYFKTKNQNIGHAQTNNSTLQHTAKKQKERTLEM